MTNEYGLDADYFRKKLKLVVAGIYNYTPQELATALTRLAITANFNTTQKTLQQSTEYKEDS